MLKEVQGDLIAMAMEGKFDVIIHGCNCFHTMGGGIARTIRDNFPEAYEADCDTLYGDRAKLGLFSYAEHCGLETSFTIVNAYTQYGFASRAQPDVFEYEAFDRVLGLINRKFQGARVGIPLIGAGLAGGDEKRIRATMEKHAKRMDLTLVVFQP
jgi:O-acetyl-ADP-ribose deacetylase (regulator of RNase III)